MRVRDAVLVNVVVRVLVIVAVAVAVRDAVCVREAVYVLCVLLGVLVCDAVRVLLDVGVWLAV